MESESIDHIVTSIPFSDHYEYSPNYADFGHNDGDDGFFAQFDYLVPELYRVTKPGRVAAIHTKDRITYGVMNGHSMYAVNEFSDKTVTAFKRHGWVFMGRIVIDTDVVRENSQTYRLGHSRNKKDSTAMGTGSLEYVLLFRKFTPSMSPNKTAMGPTPVTKNDDYTRARWQIEASGVWRSSGDELPSPDAIAGMSISAIYHWWKGFCDNHGYDYPTHVQFCEAVNRLRQAARVDDVVRPHSGNPDIWTDIVRVNTLNTPLKQKENQSHVCPLQHDVVQRLIRRFSNEGETILDPFGGVMTVPYNAIQMGRRGIGIELSPNYFDLGVKFLERIEADRRTPSLFDLMEAGAEAVA